MAGRIALVTGGTRGLGRAIALGLAEAGHVPALVYKSDRAAAEEALELVREHAPNAMALSGDVADEADVERMVSAIETGLGPIGIVVNNAFRSGRPPKKTHELDIRAWREDVDVNLTGQLIVTRACLPRMIEEGFGRIVFIGSLAQRGEPGRVAYATVKAALSGLAKTLALEYAKDGITANVVSPGFIDAGAFLRLSEEIRERALRLVPAHRAGRPEEVAALVAYLASELGGFVNGQVLGIDGGAR